MMRETCHVALLLSAAGPDRGSSWGRAAAVSIVKKDVSEGTRGVDPERPAMIQTRLSKSTVISIGWIARDTPNE
jgi:hypothetical protein